MPTIGRQLREDDFVANVVLDPREPPDTAFLIGFLGRAPEVNATRIYLDVQLAAYFDLPTEEILHAEPISRSQSPLGGHYIWLLRSSATTDKVREANRRLSQMQQEAALEMQISSTAFGVLPSGWPASPIGS